MTEPKPITLFGKPFDAHTTTISNLPFEHKLKYDPDSLAELVYYEAGKIIKTVSIYSTLTFHIVSFIITITGEKNMAAGLITLKVLKWIGVAVGTGGFAAGFIDPQTAMIIGGASYVLFDAVYFILDYLDDKKINKSIEVK